MCALTQLTSFGILHWLTPIYIRLLLKNDPLAERSSLQLKTIIIIIVHWQKCPNKIVWHVRYALAICYTNVFADCFSQLNKNTIFLSKNYWSSSLKISFYEAVHSYACQERSSVARSDFFGGSRWCKHGSVCWFPNRPPAQLWLCGTKTSSAASQSNPNEGTSFEQNFAFFALEIKASRHSLSPPSTNPHQDGEQYWTLASAAALNTFWMSSSFMP